MKDKLYGLDHLRTLAIILVFIYHYGIFSHPEWMNTAGKFGWTGVDLFFVLSGYLIASQLFQQSIDKGILLRQFFIKRFFRILPAYFVVLAIYFLFPSVHERPALAPLWKYLTFTQNLGLDLRTQGTFSHAWSLCIEEQFYLLLPIILSGMVYCKAIKKGYWLLAALFATGFLARLYSYQLVLPYRESGLFGVLWYKWIYYPTFCRLDGLLTGVAIAAFLQYKPAQGKRILRYGNKLLLLSIAILTAAYIICREEQSFEASVFGFPLVSMGYGVMVLGALSPLSFLYRYKSGVTATIATLSYGIYLVHKFIIHITQEQFAKLDVETNSNLMLSLCVFTVLLGAWLLNKLIEKPFLNIRNKLLRPE